MQSLRRSGGQPGPWTRILLQKNDYRRKIVPSLHGHYPSKGCRAYNIAVVGLGHRGYGSHFKSLFESSSDSIVAVCDADHRVLRSFSDRHPSVPAYLLLSQLLQAHRPDFAIVSVPHSHQLECVLHLSQNGIPILKEKPVAESMEDFQKMTTLPVKIGITFQKRFEPQFEHLKNLLEQVGDLARVEAKLTLNITNLEATWRASAGVGTTV
jgi:predicted dehydrogenase